MNFLVDAQLPPALCGWLQERGHEARHVGDLDLLDASDVAIVHHVEINGLVLVSKDDDFVALRLPDKFILLWLRCGNASNRALSEWLEARWVGIEALLDGGERFIEAR